MLDVARHDLVVRPEVEPGEDDVAAVGRRSRQRDLRRLHREQRGELRAHHVAQLERAREVRLAAATLRGVDELLGDDRLDGRPRERPVRARVQVREPVEDREGGADLFEGRRQAQG